MKKKTPKPLLVNNRTIPVGSSLKSMHNKRTARWLFCIGVWLLSSCIGLLPAVLASLGGWVSTRLQPAGECKPITASQQLLLSRDIFLAFDLDLSSWTKSLREWLRDKTLVTLQTMVNGEVSLGDLTIASWNQVVFHNLSLRQDGVEVLSVPQATLTVNVLSQVFSFFTLSSVHVNGLTLTAPVLQLVQHPETGWNITTLFRSSKKPSTSKLFLESMEIQQGRIAVRQGTGEESSLTGLSTTGSFASLPAGMQIDLSTLMFVLKRPGIPEVRWSGGLEYKGTQSPAVLSLSATDIRTAQSHGQVSGTVTVPSAPMFALTANIERLDPTELQLIAPSLPLRQELSGKVQIDGPLSALHLTAAAHAPDGGAVLMLTANLKQTPPHYEGTLAVERLIVQKVLEIADVSGNVSGQLSFTGDGSTLATAHSTLQAKASTLSVYGRELGDLTMTGRLAERQLELTGEAQGPLGKVEWQGQLGLLTPLTYEVSLAGSNLVARQLLENTSFPPTQLNVQAQVNGSGTTMETMKSRAKLTLLSSQVGALTNVRGQLSGALQHGHVTLETLTLETNATTLTAHGKLDDLQKTPRGTLTYTLVSQNLAPWLVEFAGQQGTGTLQLKGTATGALHALQVEGEAELANLRYSTYTVQKGAVSYAFTQRGSEQARGHLTAKLTQIEAVGSWRTATIDLSLKDTQPLVVQTEVVARNARDRTQRMISELRYEPARMEVLVRDLMLQLPTGTWRNPRPARFVVQNQTLTVDNFLLRHAAATVSVKGVLARQGRQDFQAQVDRLSLADLQTILNTTPEISGRLNGEIQVRGTAAHPEILTTVETGAVTVAGQPYAGLTVRSVYQHQRLAVNATLRQDAVHTLTVAGGAPLSLDWTGQLSLPVLGEADFRIQSAGLSIAFLELFRRDIQNVQGTVSMDVQVRGPIQALEPSGNIQLQEGQVGVKPLNVTFKDMQVQANLVPNAIHISQLVIRAGGGHITGSGSLALQQYHIRGFDLSLVSEHFQVINTYEYHAAVSGRLIGSGSLQQPVFRGSLELNDTALRPDLLILKSGPPPRDPTIVVIRDTQEPKPLSRSQRPPPPTSPHGQAIPGSTFYKSLTLNVTVTAPRGTWVYLEEGTLEISGQVHVHKDPLQPLRVDGAIETVRGWYTFHGRKFTLEHGRLILTGATPPNPSLDIAAQYTIHNYTVTVIIGGTVHQPTLTLSSEPTLEQADILSLLVFGRTTDSLNGGERAQLQSQVVQATIGYLANDLRQSLAAELGIENLEIETGQNLGQTRIGVGQYLTPDVFVSTSQALGDINSREVAVEYHLDQHWELRASTTSKGAEGLDLLWKKNY